MDGGNRLLKALACEGWRVGPSKIDTILICNVSGKKKAHKHNQFCPVIVWVRGALPTRWPGVKCLYVLCAERKEYKHFGPGIRPGGSVTGVTEKLFMCQMFMCPFWPLMFAAPYQNQTAIPGL